MRRTCICGREFTTDCNDGYCSDACEEHDAEERKRADIEELLTSHQPTEINREET